MDGRINARQREVRRFLFLILFGAAGCAAATAGFQLGVNFSEWLTLPANNGAQIATDDSGAVYVLTNTLQFSSSPSTVTKVTPDGKTIVWQNQIGFAASAMTVDPNGGVYVISARQQGTTAAFIAKLSTTGSGLTWKFSTGQQVPSAIAADSQGRVYFTAPYSVSNAVTSSNVARLNAAGSATDFVTAFTGSATSIAVAASGAAYVAGTSENQGGSVGFLASFAPDGSAGYYTVLPVDLSQTVAVDGNGNVTLLGYGVLQRIDSAGAVTLTTTVFGSAFALDAAGNAYVAGFADQVYHVRNSLATCGFARGTAGVVNPTREAQVLTVLAPDGSTLQATYIPGADYNEAMLLAVTPGGTVLTAASAGPAFTPTQAGPFAAGTNGSLFLTALAPTASGFPTATFPLTCAANSASLAVDSISPGELISLFGDGLGPQQGVQAEAVASSQFPNKVADVQVTFDGVPAPLLWVQDGQINVVTPFSLTAGQDTQICVNYGTVQTHCLTWPVVQAAPAVFMVDRLYAAALNQDGTYNSASNPATPGSIVTVYATGLGPISPSQADGSVVGFPLPTNNLTFGVEAAYADFGPGVDIPFEMQYGGPAPTLVAGVTQINFRVESFPSFGAIYLYMGSTFNPTAPGSIVSPGFLVYITGE